MNIRTAKKVAGSIKKVVEENIGQPGSDDEVYIGADERPTYRVDDLAEKAALSALAGESVAVLSEEGGLIFLDESPDYLCVLDPLDGSRNAIKGIPFYCCSVALAPWSRSARLSDVEIGVVLNLVSSDLFECERGKGAKHGGKELKTSSKTALKDVTTSVYLKSGYHIIPKFSKVRGMGAVALELAHVAAGGIDCLLDNRGYLKVTDVAAGALLVEEAGGKISDSQGNNLNQSITRLGKVSILASGNQKLHKNILSEVGRG